MMKVTMIQFLKRVDHDTYQPKKYVLYVVTHPGHYKGEFDLFEYIKKGMGYAGVTGNEIRKRWKDHKAHRTDEKRNSPLQEFIEKHGYTFDECFRVVFEGTLEECMVMEYMLRPFKNMGLNRAIGGWKKIYRYHDARLWKILESIVWTDDPMEVWADALADSILVKENSRIIQELTSAC